MTIDKQAFATGMGLLCGAFGRNLDAAVSRAYYGVLSPKLTTAEFEAAIQQCLEHGTYWPSPATVLGAVRQDAESKAVAALEHVTRVVREAGGFRFLPYATYHREFDAPTKAALSAIGGLPALGNANEERHLTLTRKFAEAYATALAPTTLPAHPTEPLRLVSGRDRAAGES